MANTKNRMSRADVLELLDETTVRNSRTPNPLDRVLERYEGVDERLAHLPSDDSLQAAGVDELVLARELRRGMTARKFTRALNGGVLSVDGFNNRPAIREVGAPTFEQCLDMALEHRTVRGRERLPANRVLARIGETI